MAEGGYNMSSRNDYGERIQQQSQQQGSGLD
jgi:hypothetical protein